MLKIQEPGSSPAVWAKNSTVLLPSQSVLLTKEQERECSAPARVCVSRQQEGSFESLKSTLIYLCPQKHKVPSATTVLLNKLAGQCPR